MPEYVVDIRQPVPPDIEICELTATVVDDGIKIYAKSKLIGDFMSRVKTEEFLASNFFNDPVWKDKIVYYLPMRMAQSLGGNSIRSEFLVNGRDGNAIPNMIWLRMKGLEEGVEVIFPQPAHMPADIIDYLSRAMDLTKTFYLRHVRNITLSAKLREVS